MYRHMRRSVIETATMRQPLETKDMLSMPHAMLDISVDRQHLLIWSTRFILSWPAISHLCAL